MGFEIGTQMQQELMNLLEEEFRFNPYTELDQTAEKIRSASGVVQYIPTSYPLPLSKRLLNAVIPDTVLVRPLPMPSDANDVENTLASSIDFLLETEGNGSVIFFCPSDLVDELVSARGAEFVTLREIELEEPSFERNNIFKSLTGVNITQSPDKLDQFALKAYFTAIFGVEIELKWFEQVRDPEWNLYLPFDVLDEVPPELQEFYFEVLSLNDANRFKSLTEPSQRSVFEVLYQRQYAAEAHEDVAAFLRTWRELDPKIQQILRTLACERLSKGRFFNKSVEDITNEGSRQLNIDIREGYSALYEGSEIDLNNPEEAAEHLIEDLGLIYHNAPDEELEELVVTAEEQMGEDKIHIEEYSREKAEILLDRVKMILIKLQEVHLVQTGDVIDREALASDEWAGILEFLHEQQVEHGITQHLDVTQIPALDEAKQRVAVRQKNREKAREVREIPVGIEELPQFVDQWATILADHYASGFETEVTLRNSLVDKYDEFSDLIVAEYDRIKKGDKYLQLADVLSQHDDEDDTVEIVVIIDGLGYVDYELMKQWSILDKNPDVEPLFSNIPSYTPSAISTLLTGKFPEQTGIFHWDVRKGSDVYNLQRDSVDMDDIPNGENISYHLIQRNDLNSSGLTEFAEHLCEIKKQGFPRSDEYNIEDIRNELTDAVEDCLSERWGTLADISEIPEDQREAARASQKSLFVLYVDKFDGLIHSDISLEEFKNYYTALGKFINQMADELLTSLEEYTLDEENYKLSFVGDHGKITRLEQNIINSRRSMGNFTQNMLKNNISLEQAHRLNLDTARFASNDGKYLLAVGNVNDESLINRARKHLEPEASSAVTDEELLDVIENRPFLLSGSKFLFGWQTESESASTTRFGFDTYDPTPTESMFDPPTTGILSRYEHKNQSRNHGYHGGTSLSEMTAVKLTYPGDSSE